MEILENVFRKKDDIVCMGKIFDHQSHGMNEQTEHFSVFWLKLNVEFMSGK